MAKYEIKDGVGIIPEGTSGEELVKQCVESIAVSIRNEDIVRLNSK